MGTESMVAGSRNRIVGVRPGACAATTAVSLLVLAMAAAHAAGPGAGGPAGKSTAVTVETVAGGVPRVTLTAKAAERLGLETGKVAESMVARKQMVSGLVIPPVDKLPAPKPAGAAFAAFGGAAAAPPPPAAMPARVPAGDAWVLVTLSPAEWDRLAKDQPARLLPLPTREELAKEVMAKPSGMPPLEDSKRSMLRLYYVVPGKDHGLTMNHRMRVELPLAGAQEKQKVVPYGAVYYDAKGVAWVYVITQPLTYERQRITVDRIAGDLAVLSEGPPVGTPVVTVGAALLYGAEIFKR